MRLLLPTTFFIEFIVSYHQRAESFLSRIQQIVLQKIGKLQKGYLIFLDLREKTNNQIYLVGDSFINQMLLQQILNLVIMHEGKGLSNIKGKLVTKERNLAINILYLVQIIQIIQDSKNMQRIVKVVEQKIGGQNCMVDSRTLTFIGLNQFSNLFQPFSDCQKKLNCKGELLNLEAVSLTISQIFNLNSLDVTSHLASKKKTDRSKFLGRLFFSDYHVRNQIQKIRLKVLIDIKNNEVSEQQEYQILSWVYSLLSLQNSRIPIIRNSNGLRDYGAWTKKQLTSLKKMMGSQIELEPEEKKYKKKAYNLNLDVRRFIGVCSKKIECPKIREKIFYLLQLPKNKTWLGKNLYKLLVSNNWEPFEMLKLSTVMKATISQKKCQRVNLMKLKPIIKQIIFQIENYLKLNSQNQGIKSLILKNDEESNQFEAISIMNIQQNNFSILKGTNISLFDSLLMETQSGTL